MGDVAQRYQDQLERIKKNVKTSADYFKENADRFHQHRKFLFVSSLSSSEKSALAEIGQPAIECNILEAFVSRLRGEFSKQEPSVEISKDYSSNVPDQIVELIESHIRHQEDEARKQGVGGSVYTDQLGGGYSVYEILTQYIGEMSFKQEIIWRRVFDPTLCGFDPLAQMPHKADGRWAFKLYPKTEDEFKEEFPDIEIDKITFGRMGSETFSFSYQNEKEKILLICDYYEKKKKKVKIVEIAQNKTVKQLGLRTIMSIDEYKALVERWNVLGPKMGIIEQAPAIVRSRMTTKTVICRYRFIENQVLEYVETDFPEFPLIFVDGNSEVIRDTKGSPSKQVTRSYIYNAIGTQQALNVSLQTWGAFLQNLVQHKFIVAKESIPEESKQAYTDYQVPNVMVYNAFLEKEGVVPGTVALPPPTQISQVDMPPAVMNGMQLSFSLMQQILGSYDASLGINNNQLSGVAIVEAATQSNVAAMPMINNYIISLNHLLQMYVDMIPKYLINNDALPIMDKNGNRDIVNVADFFRSINYDPKELKVKVEAGLNFSIQKSKALQQMISVAQAMPIFAQFINAMGLDVLVDNLEIRGVDLLKEKTAIFMQQMQQQQQQQMQMQQQQMANNPLALKAQVEDKKVQVMDKKANIELARFEMDKQQQQFDNRYKAATVGIQQQQVENDQVKLALDAKQAHEEGLIQFDKHRTEQMRTAADMAIKAADMKHNHEMDRASLAAEHSINSGELGHKLLKTTLEHQRHEAGETKQQEINEHE